MRTVLFDLDGTLTDSGPGITACIRHAMTQMGRDAPDSETLHWCIGPPLSASFAKLLSTDDPAMLAQAVSHYRSRFATTGFLENAVYDGVVDMLERVREQRYRMHLVTAKPLPYATKIVEHFDLRRFFDGLYGSGMDGTHGDKTELISHVLSQEHLTARDTVMVGDREHDVIGSAHCGIGCIGVSYGYGTAAELRGSRAIAARPGDIPGLLAAYFETPGKP
ncbi:MAG: HAD hydrolase-like protein [Hyphomicrobiales bacterium]|nr:HAD hydrolase-like protein [Alphaproteobacteria bacterium]